jgi:hypothetical protein
MSAFEGNADIAEGRRFSTNVPQPGRVQPYHGRYAVRSPSAFHPRATPRWLDPKRPPLVGRLIDQSVSSGTAAIGPAMDRRTRRKLR